MKYYWQYIKWLLKLSHWKPFRPTFKFSVNDKEQKVGAKYNKVGKIVHVSITLPKSNNNDER